MTDSGNSGPQVSDEDAAQRSDGGGSESQVAPGLLVDEERSTPPPPAECSAYTARSWSPTSDTPEDDRCVNCGQPEARHIGRSEGVS